MLRQLVLMHIAGQSRVHRAATFEPSKSDSRVRGTCCGMWPILSCNWRVRLKQMLHNKAGLKTASKSSSLDPSNLLVVVIAGRAPPPFPTRFPCKPPLQLLLLLLLLLLPVDCCRGPCQ
jgi:hypothetical protein